MLYEVITDPHVWFDVTLWMKAVERVGETLAQIDPKSGETYRENARTYLGKLSELHEYVRQQAGSLPTSRRVLITAHDAFNYFGRAYGIEVHGVQGISTVSEAGTADIKALANLIVEKRIPAVFVETSVPRITSYNVCYTKLLRNPHRRRTGRSACRYPGARTGAGGRDKLRWTAGADRNVRP